jgi:hypothetical protein
MDLMISLRGIKKRILIKTIFLFLLPALAQASGLVDADFLRVEPSARTTGMSGAFCGVADDLAAITYNPAGLSQIKRPCVSLTHFASFADTNTEDLSGAMPVWKGIGAASVLCDYTMDFSEFDEYGDEKGKVQNYDIVLTGSYGWNILPALAAGVNLKGFYSRLYIYGKYGAAIDAGALVTLGKSPDTRAGICVQNIGAQTAYISVADPLPTNIKAGISTKFAVKSVGNFLLSLDVNRLLGKDETPTLDTGLEAEVYDMLVLRAGYGFRHDVAGLSLGIGILLEKVKFSYSYQPFDTLGTAHRLTLDLDIY